MNEKFELWEYLLSGLGFWLINMIFLNIQTNRYLRQLREGEKAKAEREDTKNNKAKTIRNKI